MFNFLSHTSTKLLIAFIVISVTIACSVNPVSGKKEVSIMSEAKEIALGQSADPQIVAAYGLYPDDKIQKFINEKGQQMAKVSHRSHLDYEFKILDSEVVNAFALPGGFVYFTRGIMAHFNNEAEFAGVLGHEIGHITARHGVKQQTKATFAQLGLIVGIIASPVFAQFAEAASQGMQLMFLKFGRDDESQSDKLGVEYSTKIGYDAEKMAEFFRTLGRITEKAGAEIPTFLSTHPDPADRYNKVREYAAEWKDSVQSNLKVNRNPYLNMIDGILYGADPKQGFVEGGKFYHPELLFEFAIPSGWQTQNSPSQFQMGEPNGKAAMILTMSQESTLDAAAQAFVTDNKLTPLEDRKGKVNGINYLAIVSTNKPDPNAQQQQQQQQQAPLKIITYFYQYGGLIYMMHGMASETDFNQYVLLFKNTLDSFAKLTDQSKINKLPTRVKVVSVPSNMTMAQALNKFNQDASQKQDIAILNSMELNTPLKKGTLIKVLELRK